MMGNYYMFKKRAFIIGTAISFFCTLGIAPAAEFKPPAISEVDFEFAKSLKEREEKVQDREEQLKNQEQELADFQKEVDGKFAKLVALQIEVKGQLEELSISQNLQFRNLIKVYSTMSSTKVAPLLNKMEDKIVAKILRAMKSDVVAKIIPKLDQDKAVAVSKKLGMLNELNLN